MNDLGMLAILLAGIFNAVGGMFLCSSVSRLRRRIERLERAR
jgi:hypothetical protein